jgi:hypothetical protein
MKPDVHMGFKIYGPAAESKKKAALLGLNLDFEPVLCECIGDVNLAFHAWSR